MQYAAAALALARTFRALPTAANASIVDHVNRAVLAKDHNAALQCIMALKRYDHTQYVDQRFLECAERVDGSHYAFTLLRLSMFCVAFALADDQQTMQTARLNIKEIIDREYESPDFLISKITMHECLEVIVNAICQALLNHYFDFAAGLLKLVADSAYSFQGNPMFVLKLARHFAKAVREILMNPITNLGEATLMGSRIHELARYLSKIFGYVQSQDLLLFLKIYVSYSVLSAFASDGNALLLFMSKYYIRKKEGLKDISRHSELKSSAFVIALLSKSISFFAMIFVECLVCDIFYLPY
jgi:hypothetical protein